MQGEIGDRPSEFSVGTGKAAQAKHRFRLGHLVEGASPPVADPRMEPVEYYRTSALRVVERAEQATDSAAPWHQVPLSFPSIGSGDITVSTRARARHPVGAASGGVGCRSS